MPEGLCQSETVLLPYAVLTTSHRFWLNDSTFFAEIGEQLAKLPLEKTAFFVDPKYKNNLNESQ